MIPGNGQTASVYFEGVSLLHEAGQRREAIRGGPGRIGEVWSGPWRQSP